ncbi:hypothetical protein ACQKRQ_21900 [Paraburkholderia sp. NPDC080076]|uniref:hypothetical protein n=1 Tax=Paraburkholderia sp. NPDC080076 TaxID=3390605 RepID=UPI003CFD47A0
MQTGKRLTIRQAYLIGICTHSFLIGINVRGSVNLWTYSTQLIRQESFVYWPIDFVAARAADIHARLEQAIVAIVRACVQLLVYEEKMIVKMGRFWNPVCVAISSLLLMPISGCQLAAIPVVTAMHVANVADQHAVGNRGKKLWDQQVAGMRDMQSRGDPMGDYLYALGNAQGWITDTSDPLQIRDLFERAIAEGSSDAKIILGTFYLTGVVPGQDLRSKAIWLPDEAMDGKLGEQLIREGMKVRCTYVEPVVDAYSNRAYLRYVSGAAWIWPTYRDGRNGIDATGHFYPLIKKDERLAAEWQDLDKQCRALGLDGTNLVVP